MSGIKAWHAGVLAVAIFGVIVTVIAGTGTARAQDDTSVLHDSPVLVVDPGMHTAAIKRADVDAAGRHAVTGSHDKTVRVWSLNPLKLEHTIRIPSGPGDVGKIYAVAMTPDGEIVAAGGWTRFNETDKQDQIYLFTRTGKLLRRIDGLPDVTLHLSFSPDGRFLAAGLGGANGIRVYDRESNWQEIARDGDYQGQVYGIAFADDGRMATTSLDGHVRLYDRTFSLTGRYQTVLGERPFGLAFSPDGQRLAVGFSDSPAVALLDGRSLEAVKPPDTDGIDNGNLFAITWSRDGDTLYAGGRYDDGGYSPVIAWPDHGHGVRKAHVVGNLGTVFAINPLPEGRLLVAAADPHLAALDADGTPGDVMAAPTFDPRAQERELSVSADGTLIDFGYEFGGKRLARFDLKALKLVAPDRPVDDLTAPPRHDGLEIEHWVGTTAPTLNGARLALEPYEASRSLAVHPDGGRFVLGTEWLLRAFDAEGSELWSRSVIGAAWAVNITGDGRLVVAAYDDGTIRWYRMDDGRELLALFPMVNKKDWVAWTPEGFYASTAGASGVLKWHVNRGWDKPPEVFPVSTFARLNRPTLLVRVLQEMEIVRALGLDELQQSRREVQVVTGAAEAPGARLHVLTIGIGAYGKEAAHLKLEYADDDARDVASALLGSQDGLYAKVSVQMLSDDRATRSNIQRALGVMSRNMDHGAGNDLAVILFSGHGGLFGDLESRSFYLLPHDVDPRTEAIPVNAVSISEFSTWVRPLGRNGRVLVLLDACRSGAALDDGTPIEFNAELARGPLAVSNISVFTSSEATEPSREDDEWKNGAFTESLLTAISGNADKDGNAMLSVSELGEFMQDHLHNLTGGDQKLGMTVRYFSNILTSVR